VKLGSAISIDSHALRAGRAEILWRGIVGIRAKVADKLVSTRTEHHEWVHISSASSASWRTSFAKVEDWNVGFSGLEGSQRLKKHSKCEACGLKGFGGRRDVVECKSGVFRRRVALVIGDERDGCRRGNMSFEGRIDVLQIVLLDNIS
jgi:hypothetical protein